MKNQFVPYALAVKLKEKGFNEPCLAYYGKSLKGVLYGNLWNGNPIEMGLPDNTYHVDVLAPLYQQVLDWLFQYHNVSIVYQVTKDKTIMNKEIKRALKLIN